VWGNIAKYTFEILPDLRVPPFHPALILGGLVVAVAANAPPVFGVRREEDVLAIPVKWRPLDLAILALVSLTAGILFLYLMVENLGIS